MTSIVETAVSGPLFDGRTAAQISVGAHLGASKIAAEGLGILRRVLGQRPRGPAKYGHIVNAGRVQIKDLSGDQVGVRLYLGGSEAFLGPILEGGARPHRVPGIRKRNRRSRRRVLALQVSGGLIFRASAEDVRTPPYRWREQAEAELEPRLQPLMEQGMREALEL